MTIPDPDEIQLQVTAVARPRNQKIKQINNLLGRNPSGLRSFFAFGLLLSVRNLSTNYEAL